MKRLVAVAIFCAIAGQLGALELNQLSTNDISEISMKMPVVVAANADKAGVSNTVNAAADAVISIIDETLEYDYDSISPQDIDLLKGSIKKLASEKRIGQIGKVKLEKLYSACETLKMIAKTQDELKPVSKELGMVMDNIQTTLLSLG